MKKMFLAILALFFGFALVSCNDAEPKASKEVQAKLEGKEENQIFSETVDGAVENINDTDVKEVKGFKFDLTFDYKNDNFVDLDSLVSNIDGKNGFDLSKLSKFTGFKVKGVYTQNVGAQVSATVNLRDETPYSAIVEADLENSKVYLNSSLPIKGSTTPLEIKIFEELNLDKIPSSMETITSKIPVDLPVDVNEVPEITTIKEELAEIYKKYQKYVTFKGVGDLIMLNINISAADLVTEIKGSLEEGDAEPKFLALLEKGNGNVNLAVGFDVDYNIKKIEYHIDLNLPYTSDFKAFDEKTLKNTKLDFVLEFEIGEFTYTPLEGKDKYIPAKQLSEN